MKIRSLVALIVVLVSSVLVIDNLGVIAGTGTSPTEARLTTATSTAVPTTAVTPKAAITTTTRPVRVVTTTTRPVSVTTTTTVPRPVVTTTTVRPVTTTTVPRVVATTTMRTAGLTIVSDGISYCMTKPGEPRTVGYWVLFSNGVRAERTVVVYGNPPAFQMGEDTVTHIALPKYLACAAGGTFTFANS